LDTDTWDQAGHRLVVLNEGEKGMLASPTKTSALANPVADPLGKGLKRGHLASPADPAA